VLRALEVNPGLAAAAGRVAAAQALTRQAASAAYPWFSASAGYARSDNPPQAFMMALNQRRLDMSPPAFNPNDPEDTDNTRLSLGVRWAFGDFGRTRADVDAAGRGAALAACQALAARNALAHEVTRAYCGVLQAQAFGRVQEETVVSLTESRRVAQSRLDAGAAVRTDVLNLDVRLAQAREDRLSAANAEALALAALNTAIGQDVATARNLVGPPAGEPASLPAEDPSVPEARPEWRAARETVAVCQARLERARREQAPALGLQGSLDWDHGDALFEGYEQSYTVGVQAEWALADGGRRAAAVEAAAAEAAAAESAAAQARRDLLLDYRQARLLASHARGRIDVARAAIENAAEALRITRERYEKGAADVTDLLAAQTALTAQRTRLVAATYDYAVALSDVSRAAGKRAADAYGRGRPDAR
jgi:outer membrane protein TolC